jgi:hypothetical protein
MIPRNNPLITGLLALGMLLSSATLATEHTLRVAYQGFGLVELERQPAWFAEEPAGTHSERHELSPTALRYTLSAGWQVEVSLSGDGSAELTALDLHGLQRVTLHLGDSHEVTLYRAGNTSTAQPLITTSEAFGRASGVDYPGEPGAPLRVTLHFDRPVAAPSQPLAIPLIIEARPAASAQATVQPSRASH